MYSKRGIPSVSLILIFSMLLPSIVVASNIEVQDKKGADKTQRPSKLLNPLPQQQQIFISKVSKKYKIDKTILEGWLHKAQKKDSIIDAMNHPAEHVLSWKKYRKIFMTKKRVHQGVEFWNKHKVALDKAQKKYGVPAEMIVAIIGVETYYGKIKGSYKVLDALYTLAFYYPKRATFFQQQLAYFFALSKQQQWQPETKIGSYAGAMGYGQFMPGSYLSYGVDFNKDGHIDLIDNPLDAIGSVANYFKRHGWNPGKEVLIKAHLMNWQASKLSGTNPKPLYSLKKFRDSGVIFHSDIKTNTKGSLLVFDQETRKDYWIGLKNFYVISRYNHSHMYSLAAYQLSQQIKKYYQKAYPETKSNP